MKRYYKSSLITEGDYLVVDYSPTMSGLGDVMETSLTPLLGQ